MLLLQAIFLLNSILSVLLSYRCEFLLFLSLQSTHAHEGGDAPVWQFASLTKVLQLESEHTPNPVIQRVKVVMSVGLVLVHTLRKWPLSADVTDEMSFGQASGASAAQMGSNLDSTVDQNSSSLFGSLTDTGTEQLLVIGFVCALAIKYIFFENINTEQVPKKQNQQQQQYSQRTFNETNAESDTQVDAQMIEGESKDLLAKDDSESTSGISESCSNTTSSSPSSSRPTTPTTSSSTNGDDLDNVPRMGKPATPSILITTQDSDTESVIAEYHRKISESRSMYYTDKICNLSFFDLTFEPLLL